jgi:hypothetical protein
MPFWEPMANLQPTLYNCQNLESGTLLAERSQSKNNRDTPRGLDIEVVLLSFESRDHFQNEN